MAYRRMGAVEGGMINGATAPGLGLDLTQWMPWQPGPLTTVGATPTPLLPTSATSSGVPPLLARPPEETSTSTPWLLLAGLGLVAYMVMR
jgi:hypothetical protein